VLEVYEASEAKFYPDPTKLVETDLWPGLALRGVTRVFTDFRYVREINDGPNTALLFETKVGDVSLNGCDFITTNDDGLISEFTVMVRPLKAANALAEAMGAQFERIQAEAIAEITAAQQQGAQQ
jgi:hypothetical protein